MKVSNLTKAVCAGAFAFTVAALPFANPVSAQTDTTDPTAPTTTTDPSLQTPVETEADDDGFDWGLLGLLGLLGLAGLARKPEERVQYRDPNNADPAATSTTRSDYYR